LLGVDASSWSWENSLSPLFSTFEVTTCLSSLPRIPCAKERGREKKKKKKKKERKRERERENYGYKRVTFDRVGDLSNPAICDGSDHISPDSDNCERKKTISRENPAVPAFVAPSPLHPETMAKI